MRADKPSSSYAVLESAPSLSVFDILILTRVEFLREATTFIQSCVRFIERN